MAQDEETVRALTAPLLLPVSVETEVTAPVRSQGGAWRKDRMIRGGIGEDSDKCSWEIFTTDYFRCFPDYC